MFQDFDFDRPPPSDPPPPIMIFWLSDKFLLRCSLFLGQRVLLFFTFYSKLSHSVFLLVFPPRTESSFYTGACPERCQITGHGKLLQWPRPQEGTIMSLVYVQVSSGVVLIAWKGSRIKL